MRDLIFIIILLHGYQLWAQETIVAGKVLDKQSGDPLIGVNITLKDKLAGTITDYDGNFQFTTKVNTPFTLVFSSVGYEMVEREIEGSENDLVINMQEQTILGQEIVVSASRVEESILRSPVSVEKLTIKDIQQMSTANFYDGLDRLKGVDMNIHSLTFRFPNTRGFNNENNYRLNQIIDGVDNVSPGLSFAAGNIFGIDQLDVESVELIVGASSALYGSGGMNGTLVMTSKNPFEYQGLSFIAQPGIMHLGNGNTPTPMYDLSMRYAKAFNDKFAFKINGSYLDATDWFADDYRDRTNLNDPELNRETNPGYDGVNVYGDDIIVPVNLKSLAPTVAENVCLQQGLQPGTPEYQACYNNVVSLMPDQVVSRTGWKEKDIVDYNTRNIRLSGALHYRFNENLEAVAEGKYSQGTSVYTAQNRFSIIGFDIYTGKLELKNPDYTIRTWGIMENSGNTYDAGTAALLMNEAWKPSEQWYQDYIGAFTQNRLLGNTEEDSYRFARIVADNRDQFGNIFNPGKPAFPLSGTDEFDQLLEQFSHMSLKDGGAKILDKSKMWQMEGIYNLSRLVHTFELLVGASYRLYSINSNGTVFYDEPGNPISVYQFGSFAQIGKSLFNDHMKLTVSARYDKHQKFEGKFTPRFSMVYSLDNQDEHNFRMSYQTAFRFPSTSDQWVDFDSGPFHSIGGLPEVQGKYNFYSNPVFPMSGSNPITATPITGEGPFLIPKFGPEKVTAMEIGYKGLYFEKKLFFDAYLYRNNYNGFLSSQLLVQNPYTAQEKRYQTVISTNDPVTSYGWAVGADLRLMKGYVVRGNIAYNSLESNAKTPGFQSRFNTPDYRLNLSIGNREVTPRIGFDVSWRWQDSFLWESNFGSDIIPAYATLNAHLSFKLPVLKSYIKIGGSNLLNHYYTTAFGMAQIGGLYYISWIFNSYQN